MRSSIVGPGGGGAGGRRGAPHAAIATTSASASRRATGRAADSHRHWPRLTTTLPWDGSICQAGEQSALLGEHAPRVGRRTLVVVPQEMEDAVGEEDAHLVGERDVAGSGLAGGGVERDDDVAEHVWMDAGILTLAQGEGEHVGGPILAAPVAVERVDLGVADQGDAELGGDVEDGEHAGGVAADVGGTQT